MSKCTKAIFLFVFVINFLTVSSTHPSINSTSYVLKLIKNNFQSGTVILFDEFYGFPNWEKYEFKALKEQLNENSFQYIAFGTRQACIQII